MEHSSAPNSSRAGNFNGEMFRLARQLRGLTQKEFSEAMHAEASTVSRMENGVSQATAELADKVLEGVREFASF